MLRFRILKPHTSHRTSACGSAFDDIYNKNVKKNNNQLNTPGACGDGEVGLLPGHRSLHPQLIPRPVPTLLCIFLSTQHSHSEVLGQPISQLLDSVSQLQRCLLRLFQYALYMFPYSKECLSSSWAFDCNTSSVYLRALQTVLTVPFSGAITFTTRYGPT
jgi:hypothetical protein